MDEPTPVPDGGFDGKPIWVRVVLLAGAGVDSPKVASALQHLTVSAAFEARLGGEGAGEK